MRGRWELSNAQWKLIEPILRPQRRADGRGRPWQDTRAVLNGILWVLGTGAQWRELPQKYPPYQACHRRFQHWVQARKLERVLQVLAEELQARGKLDLEEAFIDTTFAGAKKGARVGDKAYDSDRLDCALAERYDIEMIAPHRGVRRKPTQDGRPLRRYCRRWRVERLFAWLHHFRPR